MSSGVPLSLLLDPSDNCRLWSFHCGNAKEDRHVAAPNQEERGGVASAIHQHPELRDTDGLHLANSQAACVGYNKASLCRVVVIVASVVVFRNPMSMQTALCTLMALGGVFAYSQVKRMKAKTT